jgi:hypothetical protein
MILAAACISTHTGTWMNSPSSFWKQRSEYLKQAQRARKIGGTLGIGYGNDDLKLLLGKWSAGKESIRNKTTGMTINE